jgi:beta-lactamase class A
MEDLINELHDVCEAQPFTTHWYLKDLTSGVEADRAGRRPVPSASTRKTSIMMAALKAVHEGRLDLAEPVRIEAAYQEGVISGVCQYMMPGLVIPLRDAIVQMIITSDNVCTHIVTDRVDLDELNQYCRSIGLTDTVHRFKVPPFGMPYDHPLEAVTTTTAADQGVLLDLILRGCSDEAVARRLGVSPALCRFAIDVLSWQRYRNMIPSLLPFDTVVANKTGMGQRGWMDAAIVFRDRSPLYILTVYTDWVPVETADGLPGHVAAFAAIGKLSRLCWDRIGRR